MRLALLLVVIAALLPSCRAGLGLGGLAPSPAGAPAATANIDVPTDLCDKEFCLAAAPAACGGNCILTPLGNTTTYCATPCYNVWNSPSVQSCLAAAAAGTYIQKGLTAIANKCNAGAIAAARRKKAQMKYNTAFPCTKPVNVTTLLGLDSCLTGAKVTATTACPAQCSAALTGIPKACRDTFPRLNPDWKPTLTSCITQPGAAPVGAVGAGSQPSSSALGPSAAAPDTGNTPTGSAPRGASAAVATVLVAVIAAAVAIA